jgi:predicted DCC family thiol-disulfide oxidoreductase YuxK
MLDLFSHREKDLAENNKDLSLRIVFFDGVCHLCNGFVDFVIQNETAHSKLIFAPLQGETAQSYLPPENRKNLNSVLLWNQGVVLSESDAILEIFKHLKLPWRWIGTLGSFMPRRLLNLFYRKIAQNRYRWFGERDSCRLPEPRERAKLWP